MPPDVRQALQGAALKPVGEPDWGVILRRGRVAQRRRLTAFATGALVAAVVAWAAARTFPLSSDAFEPAERPAPAAGACAPEAASMTLFFEPGTTEAEVGGVGRSALRLTGIASVRVVDRRDAYRDLIDSFEDVEGRHRLPHHAFPAWLAIEADSQRTARTAAGSLRELDGVAEVDVMSRFERKIMCEFRGER